MIQINEVKMNIGHTTEELESKICQLLKWKDKNSLEYSIVKRSIDARKKPDIYYSYVIHIAMKNEQEVVKKLKNSKITVVHPVNYQLNATGEKKLISRPIIVGSGPAGLFCAYELALNGYQPILIERGECVDKRLISVQQFWDRNTMNPNSNVQFGEGGAGTFSDGKLNTLVKDKWGRNREVLRIFRQFGAEESILYDNKPHIGTDILINIVRKMRETIISLGGEVRFETVVTKLLVEDMHIVGVELNGEEQLRSEVVVLAIGHSARDTFEQLYLQGIEMQAKSFAVGVRVEHLQKDINRSQYGKKYYDELPPAPYKLTFQANNGRGVYSFCMCPGGYVVNASSEEGCLAINGMSYSKRDSKNANSAIIISVTEKDFEMQHPLAGIQFQRKLEKEAYRLGNGLIPVQTLGDFRANQCSKEESFQYDPEMKGKYQLANLTSLFPLELKEAFLEGMTYFGRIIEGYDAPETILSGIESRTSSPVRIVRNENLQSNVEGLFPCGEGAGYAGGIMSAAMDGMKVAEMIAKIYSPFSS